MPRYYLHIRSADGTALDEEGTDLPDLNSAREHALAGAREMLASAIKVGNDRIPESIVVTDVSGKELAAIPFRDALPTQLRD